MDLHAREADRRVRMEDDAGSLAAAVPAAHRAGQVEEAARRLRPLLTLAETPASIRSLAAELPLAALAVMDHAASRLELWLACPSGAGLARRFEVPSVPRVGEPDLALGLVPTVERGRLRMLSLADGGATVVGLPQRTRAAASRIQGDEVLVGGRTSEGRNHFQWWLTARPVADLERVTELPVPTHLQRLTVCALAGEGDRLLALGRRGPSYGLAEYRRRDGSWRLVEAALVPELSSFDRDDRFVLDSGRAALGGDAVRVWGRAARDASPAGAREARSLASGGLIDLDLRDSRLTLLYELSRLGGLQVVELDERRGVGEPREIPHGLEEVGRALGVRWIQPGRSLLLVTRNPGEGTRGHVLRVDVGGGGER